MATARIQTRLREVARRSGLRKGARLAAAGLGYDLLRRHYYSPVPDLDSLDPGIWTRESELGGLQFDVGAGLDFVRRELAPHLSEYRPPRAPTGNARDFHLDNSLYESIDAESLYAMVRRFAPPRILELGSGMSTLVIADARARNAHRPGDRHRTFDPFPDPELRPILQQVCELSPIAATDVPLEEFAALRAGDMLFVDTTHTVKIGSDVNHVILDVLPMLAPGVMIHFHDIFLPWEYPREFVLERSFYWAEQYLLQAFLAFNNEFEILFSAHALQRRHPEALGELIPSATLNARPAALWLRRVEH